MNRTRIAVSVRATENLCRIAVNEMRDFHLHATGYFDRRMKKIASEVASATPSNPDYEDHLAELVQEMKEHKNNSAYFAILMIFSAFERFLQELYDLTWHLASRPELRDVVIPVRQTRTSLDEFNAFLKRLDVDVSKAPYDWKGMIQVRSYRNAIAHQGGWVTDFNYKHLSVYGHRIGEKLEILGFVAKAGKLVDETTHTLSEDFLHALSNRGFQ